EIPIHGMRVKGRAGYGEVVKSPGSFARFVQANGQAAVGKPREGAAARQALQIDDPVEGLFSHPADAAPEFRPVGGRSPPATLEMNHTSQIGIALEERREGRFNPPVDLAVG